MACPMCWIEAYTGDSLWVWVFLNPVVFLVWKHRCDSGLLSVEDTLVLIWGEVLINGLNLLAEIRLDKQE